MSRRASTIISEIEQHYNSSAPLDRGCKTPDCNTKSKTGICIDCLTIELMVVTGKDKAPMMFRAHMLEAAKLKMELLK